MSCVLKKSKGVDDSYWRVGGEKGGRSFVPRCRTFLSPANLPPYWSHHSPLHPCLFRVTTSCYRHHTIAYHTIPWAVACKTQKVSKISFLGGGGEKLSQFFHKYCSKLLFTTHVHNSSSMFTNIAYNSCLQIMFTTHEHEL